MSTLTQEVNEVIGAVLPLPNIDIDDGQTIIWAALALAKLVKFVVASQQTAETNGPYAEPLAYTLKMIVRAFRGRWPDLVAEHRIGLMDKLKVYMVAHHESLGVTIGTEEMYLLGRFDAFHMMVLSKAGTLRAGELHPGVMAQQVVNALKPDFLEYAVNAFLEEHEIIMARKVVAERHGALNNLVQVHTQKLLSTMSTFLMMCGDLDKIPSGDIIQEIHTELVEMAQEPLCDHIAEALRKLSAKLVMPASRIQKRDYVRAFVKTIATFFGDDCPLLQTEEAEDLEMVGASDDSDDESGSDQDTDEEWEEFEVDPSELEDVLIGPETVTVSEVSHPVTPGQSTNECGICGQNDDEMLSLKVCKHVFCKECLNEQLQARGNFRYRCALCRSHIVPGMDTPEEEVSA